MYDLIFLSHFPMHCSVRKEILAHSNLYNLFLSTGTWGDGHE